MLHHCAGLSDEILVWSTLNTQSRKDTLALSGRLGTCRFASIDVLANRFANLDTRHICYPLVHQACHSRSVETSEIARALSPAPNGAYSFFGSKLLSDTWNNHSDDLTLIATEMSYLQSQSQTVQVLQNAAQIAYWPPYGTTRVLATSGLNGCTALGIVSPLAGILAHIAPLSDGQSATSDDDDPGKRNLINLVQAVIDLYNQNRAYLAVAQSFVVVAIYGGSTALPEHRQTIQAVLQRLGLPCIVKEYNVLETGTPRAPGETSVVIVSDGLRNMPAVFVNGNLLQS